MSKTLKKNLTEYNLEKRREIIKQRKLESDLILNKYRYFISPPKKKLLKLNKTKKNITQVHNFLPSINEYSTPKIKKKRKYYVKLIKKPKENLEEDLLESKKENEILYLNKDKISFNEYLKIQSRAEQRLRPLRGDLSTDFFDSMKKINEIRSSVMEKEVEKILDVEDRYNEEYPEEDIYVKLQDKGLNHCKWKNLFPLQTYQNFFLDEIKGKISSVNYRSLLKKFRQISKICFTNGKVNYASIAHNLGEY
jgi:hypothetical protein